jgi:hypothetical protein
MYTFTITTIKTPVTPFVSKLETFVSIYDIQPGQTDKLIDAIAFDGDVAAFIELERTRIYEPVAKRSTDEKLAECDKAFNLFLYGLVATYLTGQKRGYVLARTNWELTDDVPVFESATCEAFDIQP